MSWRTYFEGDDSPAIERVLGERHRDSVVKGMIEGRKEGEREERMKGGVEERGGRSYLT